jgi:hypothetical protein
MYKERNNLLDELENNFENDNFWKRDKLDSASKSFLNYKIFQIYSY